MKLSELREAVKSGEYIAPPTLEEKKLLEDNSQFLSYQVAKHDAAEAKKQRKNLNAVAHIMATEAAGEKPKLEVAPNIDPTKTIDRDWSAEPEGNKFVKMFNDNIEANGIRLSTPSMEKQWENNVTENAKALYYKEWKEYELKYRNALNEAKAKLGLESLPQEIANSFNEVIANNAPQRNDNEYIRQVKVNNIHNYGLTLSAFRKSDFTSTSNKGKYTNSSKIEWDVLRTAHGIINGVEKPTGENHKYTLMNDDEKAVFNYYIGSGDYASAKKYLDTINSTLQARLSQTVSKQWAQEGVKGDLKELGTAIVGGAETGIMDMTRSAIGIADAFGIKNGQESFSSLIAPTYQEQLASTVLAESKNSNHWFFNDVLLAVNSGVRQIPSMLITASGGAFLGRLMQSVGSATTEAMRNNTNSAADVLYGVYEAAMEYATDLALGGATAQLMGKGANPITKKLLSGVSKVVKNPKVAKMLSKGVILLGTGGSEWAEESIQALAEPAARAIIYNEKMDYNDETLKNALEAGFVGFLSGLMLGIPSVNSIYNQTQIELVGQNYIDSGNLAKLVKWAEDFGATDTPQYDNVKEAMLNNKPVDAGDVGGLLIHTNKTFNQFSPSDIAAFIKNTVKTSTPKDIADVMFNGNVEAAQKFIDKYSGMSVSEIAATAAQTPEAELPNVILGTAQNYDEVEAAQKEIADNENKSRTEDIAKIKSAVQSRLVELGEKGNIEVLSSAITKVLAGEQLTKSEQRIISESRFGQRVLNEATAENVESGEYSSGWAEKIGTERINSRAYNLGVEGVDSAAVNGYNNTDENGRVGGNINGSQNAELLAGGKVSAVSGGRNSLREQSPNTARLKGYLGNVGTQQAPDFANNRAGESGWLVQKESAESKTPGFDEGVLRRISGIAPSGKDTLGRIIDSELLEEFKNTVFKDENGNLLSLYHWTTAVFDKFAKGEFGFHLGTLEAAHDRYLENARENPDTPIGNYKELYVNITNPIELNDGVGVWNAAWVSLQLLENGLINEKQYVEFSLMESFYDATYDNPAAEAVRNLLFEKGYDGIIYKNNSEGGGNYSVIALRPDQIITVAENGILKENSGVTEADFTESANFMPENSDLQSTAEESEGITEPDISKDTRSEAEQIAEMVGGSESEKTVARRFVRELGKALGIKVVFEDTVSKRGYFSDGYIDSNKVIHIDYANENPIAFLFRHEMVHYGSGSKFYKQFVKLVYSSKQFEQWLQEKTKMPAGSSVERMAAKYMTMTAKAREGVETLSETELQEEMVADFAGSDIFTHGGSGLKAISTEVSTKQRNAVSQWIADFISWIKKKIQKVQGADKLTFELSRIEDSFNRMISDAKQNPTESKLKHSIAGVRAKTANLEEQGNAKRRTNFLEDPEIVRKETGWWKGKDGEWRFYIPDNEMEFNANGFKDNPQTLGDYVKHDKLFAAYPELKDIKLSFETMKKGDKGSYNIVKNAITINEALLSDEEAFKDCLIHEIQHAIQCIEGFAKGANLDIAEYSVFNLIYDKVKNSKGFIELSSSKEKVEYVWKQALKIFGAKSEKDIHLKVYKNIYGEKEANQVSRLRYFDEDLLKLSTPDSSGIIIDGEEETQKFIDNLKEIGYTEDEIDTLYGGSENDKSRSFSSITQGVQNGNRGNGFFPNTILENSVRNSFDNTQSKRKSGFSGRGVQSGISDRGRGIENTQADSEESAFSMPENKIRRSVPIDENPSESSKNPEILDYAARHQELFEQYQNGELTAEEYKDMVNVLFESAGDEKGTIPKGETVTGKENFDNPVPLSVNDEGNTQRFVRTVLEGGQLTEEMVHSVKQQILSGEFAYEPTSNEANFNYAKQAVEKNTAESIWEKAVNGDGLPNKNEIAIGEALLKQAIQNNDAAKVIKYTAELADMGTRLGQSVQALSLLKRMDGLSQLVYVKRAVDTLNNDLQKRFKAKATIVQIDENMAMRLAQSKTQEDIELTYGAIMNDIAAQVPATFLDKWNAWRYMAMLSNPTTHIRNLTGNGIFVPAISIKNILAATAEKAFVKKENRTKSVVIKKAYKEFANKDFEKVADVIASGGKMNPKRSIADNKPIFKTKALEALRKFNFDLLEKEDVIFLKKHYKTALAGFLQARNVNLSNVSDEILSAAREYAILEAQKATYRDANGIANAIQRFSGKNAVINLAIEGILPFKKTPMNIIRRGIDYSPIGIIKTLGKAAVQLKNGEFTATQFIDGIAAGLTGTGIMALGMLLSSLGIAVGGFDDDDEDKFRKLNGEQEYAIRIGDTSYTIDWAAPVVIPFFIGVAINEMSEAESNETILSNLGGLATAGLEPIINLSMLSGIQETIAAARYADADEIIYKVAGNVVGSYFTQSLPTIGGKVANTVDDTRRSNYIDKTSNVPTWLQSAVNTVKAKVPVLSSTRPEYIDAWGENKHTGSFIRRFFQNFLSPGYISEISDGELEKEITRLVKSTGEASVIPDNAPKYFKFKKNTKNLNAEEYELYASLRGGKAAEYVYEAIASKNYVKLTDAQKAEVISNIYKYCNAYAKANLTYTYDEVNLMYDGKLSQEKYNKMSSSNKKALVQEYFLENYSKALTTEKNGGSVPEYFIKKAKNK